jgi:hypothetical protein
MYLTISQEAGEGEQDQNQIDELINRLTDRALCCTCNQLHDPLTLQSHQGIVRRSLAAMDSILWLNNCRGWPSQYNRSRTNKAKLVIQTGGTLDRESSCPAKTHGRERRERDLREEEGSQEPSAKLLRQRTVGIRFKSLGSGPALAPGQHCTLK